MYPSSWWCGGDDASLTRRFARSFFYWPKARQLRAFSTLELRAISGATSIPTARQSRGGHVARRTLAYSSAPQQTRPKSSATCIKQLWMRRLALIAALATTALALEDWIRVWPKSGRQSRRLTSDLDCAPFDASHLVARPRRKRADCQFYDQPDKNDDGLLCIGDRFKIANEVSFCAEPYSPGSWYLAAKKGIDLGQGRRLGADPATFDYHPTNGY